MSTHNMSGLKRDEKGRNIQVVVRCRPFNTVERKSSHGVIDCEQSTREVVVRLGGVSDKASRKTYTFDKVFGPAAKQIDVYRSVVYPILDEVIMGYNCTVFAYGQTGTGKTFTMEGERSPDEQFTWEEDPLAGIIPRTLHQIFEKLTENGTEFSVKVSLLEIYNEELFDLLSPTEEVNERLQLFDDPRNKRGVVVKGQEEVTVHNKDEVYQILERGAAKRRTASTLMNAYSSRSHSVFSVTIHMKEITLDGEELVKIGKLNLVDLAGSENIGRSGAVDKRAREAGNINQSLLTLGRVITALVEKRPHIPYRESKLTRILQDSLGGRTKTSIIATVSPSSCNLEETLSTLEYASRAKNILNKPEVNQKLTKRTLIKEYTEEIERLKRELAATRDKNGIYLAAQNYERIMGQISCQEEQITEYVDKIAAMEEELKKVSELFEDSKSQLERCVDDLDQKQQRLEETSRSLQETKEKLLQEEFVCSELHSAQENLYDAAGQLLSAVGQSTSDVSGLHAKLDRKSQVEQHNQRAQQSFAQQMDGALGSVQRRILQHGELQRRRLSGYSQAVDGLLLTNQAALRGAVASVESFAGRVEALMAAGAARCREKVQQQEALSRRDKELLLQLLEEHQQDVEEVLVAQTLLGVAAAKELCSTLTVSMETQRALANEVEAMKEDGAFFSGLAQQVAALRQEAERRLGALQAERDAQEEEIQRVQESAQQSVLRLQQQLDQDLDRLRSGSRSLRAPLQSLQEELHSACGSVEQQASARAGLLSSASVALAASLRQRADESLQTVGEVSEQCSYIHGSVSGLVQRHLQWSGRAAEEVERRATEQMAAVEESRRETESLTKSVEACCSQQLQAAEEELAARQEEAQQAAGVVQEQTAADRSAAEQEEAELREQVEASRRLVSSFLQDELQCDVPTGTTPQRREFVYPREVVKSQSRAELLESLRRQQEALLAALEEEEEQQQQEEEEEKAGQDHDSEEDAANENIPVEPPFIDDSLVFNQSQRLPFFKQKKGGKHQSKIPGRPKTSENEAAPATPPRARPPFHCVN